MFIVEITSPIWALRRAPKLFTDPERSLWKILDNCQRAALQPEIFRSERAERFHKLGSSRPENAMLEVPSHVKLTFRMFVFILPHKIAVSGSVTGLLGNRRTCSDGAACSQRLRWRVPFSKKLPEFQILNLPIPNLVIRNCDSQPKNDSRGSARFYLTFDQSESFCFLLNFEVQRANEAPPTFGNHSLAMIVTLGASMKA